MSAPSTSQTAVAVRHFPSPWLGDKALRPRASRESIDVLVEGDKVIMVLASGASYEMKRRALLVALESDHEEPGAQTDKSSRIPAGHHEHGALYVVVVEPQDAPQDASIKIGFTTSQVHSQVTWRYERRFRRSRISLLGWYERITRADEQALHRLLRPHRTGGREWYGVAVLDHVEVALHELVGAGNPGWIGGTSLLCTSRYRDQIAARRLLVSP